MLKPKSRKQCFHGNQAAGKQLRRDFLASSELSNVTVRPNPQIGIRDEAIFLNAGNPVFR